MRLSLLRADECQDANVYTSKVASPVHLTSPGPMDRQPDLPRRNALSNQQTNHTYCAAAAEADRKVELLGGEVVNSLEKRVNDLEDLNLEQRVDTLFQRLRPYEDYKTLVEEQVAKLRETEQILKTKKNELELSVKSNVQDQEAALKDLTRKVSQLQDQIKQQKQSTKKGEDRAALLDSLNAPISGLESETSSSSTEATTAALDLLQRLQDGVTVHPALARQIKLALSRRRESDISEDQGNVPAKWNTSKTAATTRLNRGISKRSSRSLTHGKYAHKASVDEIRKLIGSTRRRRSDNSSSLDSLSRTPSADLSSAKQTGSGDGSGFKVSLREKEVPETQQKEDFDVEMNDQDAVSEPDDDPPFIPGERKSGRKPKPRVFEDQVDWKEANKSLRGQ